MVRSLVCQPPQRAPQFGLFENCSDPQRDVLVNGTARGICPWQRAANHVDVEGMQRKTLLGMGDRRREDLSWWKSAILPERFEPAGGISRDQGSPNPPLPSLIRELVGRPAGRRISAEIEDPRQPARLMQQQKANASDAAHVGLDDTQRHGHGDCGIDGMAPRLQHLEAGRRRQRMGRRDRSAQSGDNGAAS